MNKFKKFKTEVDKLDLSKKGSPWVNKRIGRIMLVAILLMLPLGFVLNDYSFSGFYYTCADSKGCYNPFYNFTESFRGISCAELRCGSEFVPLDFEVGNDSNLLKNLGVIQVLLFLAIFPLSRLHNYVRLKK